ncbi:hypothetical protein C0J52_16185 [Blattella germanica]|nr:hypothetical protein C0J52_16185 [Blattella germanica]
MWQPIKIDRSDYIIKKDTFNGKHVVLLSNFIKIWGEEMSSVKFFERCKKFNPLMEGDQDNLIDWILSLLVNENNANIKVIECDESKVMELKTNLSGIPFLFKFYLDPIDPEKLKRGAAIDMWRRIEALNEGTDTEDSGVQTALSDSSPEKRRKLNKTNAKETSNAVQQRLESEAQEKVKIKKEKETEEEYQRKLEEKLLAKQRKEAMKKKRLNL